MRITLDIPDKYADVLTLTCISNPPTGLNVLVRAVELKEREGQTLKLYEKDGFANHIWFKEESNQVAKKPEIEIVDCDCGTTVEKCLCCKNLYIDKGDIYCSKYGQKLDWGEEDG